MADTDGGETTPPAGSTSTSTATAAPGPSGAAPSASAQGDPAEDARGASSPGAMDPGAILAMFLARFSALASSDWTAQWAQTREVLQRIGATLVSLGMHWASLRGDASELELDEELLAELTENARELVQTFPHAAQLLDGVESLDTTLVELFTSAQGRARLGVVTHALEAFADAQIRRVVDFTFSDQAVEGASKLYDRLDELERSLSFLLERFVVPIILRLRMDPSITTPRQSQQGDAES